MKKGVHQSLILILGDWGPVGIVVPDWRVELVLLVSPFLLGLWVGHVLPCDVGVPDSQTKGVEGGHGHPSTQAHKQRDQLCVKGGL